MLLKFEAEATSSRPMPKGPEAEAKAGGYEAPRAPFGLEALTSLDKVSRSFTVIVRQEAATASVVALAGLKCSLRVTRGHWKW